ncbi:MAG: methyltransferase [Deltaproteobacteria bacterium]|nr:methyltransferase [Deltaproteobacteria bacterium]
MTSEKSRIRAFIEEETRRARPPLVPELTLRLIDATCRLWRATAKDLELEQIVDPYWAFAWPGGQAVGRMLLDRPELVKGRSVLDFGAGSGIAGLAAALAGAKSVTCADIDPFAAVAIELNAELNGVSVEITTRDYLEGSPGGSFDVILLADVLYDDGFAAKVSRFAQNVAPSTQVLLGDPGRGRVPVHLELLAEYDAPADVDPGDGRTTRRTFVYAWPPRDRAS